MFSPKKSRISTPNNNINDTNQEFNRENRIVDASFQSPRRKQPVIPIEKYANIKDFINIKKQIITNLHQYHSNLNEKEGEERKIKKYLDDAFRQKVRYIQIFIIYFH